MRPDVLFFLYLRWNLGLYKATVNSHFWVCQRRPICRCTSSEIVARHLFKSRTEKQRAYNYYPQTAHQRLKILVADLHKTMKDTFCSMIWTVFFLHLTDRQTLFHLTIMKRTFQTRRSNGDTSHSPAILILPAYNKGALVKSKSTSKSQYNSKKR